ncbi:hypothetical protein BHE74_00013958 [Ensete ventricosum]|nr:hypothetical protein BHE74_00013958 [Ensete ventricosum]RZS08375.1 hypothetical protein BHM03_00039332 [Ensete ventricosum]
MLDLTSAVTSGVTKSYGESVDAKAWREGMAPHAAFGLARHPDASTSDVDVAIELARHDSTLDVDVVVDLSWAWVNMVSMNLMRDNPKVGGGRSGIVSSTLAMAPMPTPHAESCSPFEVQENPSKEATRPSEEEARGAPEVPSKRRAGDLIDQKKKSKDSGRHRLPHEADRSVSQTAKGKGLADPTEETPTPKAKPRSVRELCSARLGVDGQDYHAIRMSSLPEHALNVPLEIDLALLTYGDGIWLDGEASTKVDLLRKEAQRPKECGDPDAVVAHRLGHRRLNLWPTTFRLNSRKRIDVGSRWRRTLARLQAQHPRVEIEEDPFALLPKDVGVLMADEQPSDDSLPPPKE